MLIVCLHFSRVSIIFYFSHSPKSTQHITKTPSDMDARANSALSTINARSFLCSFIVQNIDEKRIKNYKLAPKNWMRNTQWAREGEWGRVSTFAAQFPCRDLLGGRESPYSPPSGENATVLLPWILVQDFPRTIFVVRDVMILWNGCSSGRRTTLSVIRGVCTHR